MHVGLLIISDIPGNCERGVRESGLLRAVAPAALQKAQARSACRSLEFRLSPGRLKVVGVDRHSHTLAIGLSGSQESSLKPEFQHAANEARRDCEFLSCGLQPERAALTGRVESPLRIPLDRVFRPARLWQVPASLRAWRTNRRGNVAALASAAHVNFEHVAPKLAEIAEQPVAGQGRGACSARHEVSIPFWRKS